MKKLYENRHTTGDVVFLLRKDSSDEEGAPIDIPVPAHALGSNGAAASSSREAETVPIRCHKHVLISQSAYFEGLM